VVCITAASDARRSPTAPSPSRPPPTDPPVLWPVSPRISARPGKADSRRMRTSPGLVPVSNVSACQTSTDVHRAGRTRFRRRTGGPLRGRRTLAAVGLACRHRPAALTISHCDVMRHS
jgi:hypothetical protein